ncbi:MAG: hypothetical protein LC648_04805 [Novosphingobium sp.]|nr:hypothetical protein [Novosphingobium sp.]
MIAVEPAASVISEVSAVPAPTAPPKVVAPAVSTARVWPPSSVEANEIAPLPVLVSVVAAPSMTASL